MKKVLFIIPYFGKLPNTFEIFLRTCRWNPDFEWLIVTDDETSYSYPDNVYTKYMSFAQFVARVQSCFDFQIALRRPYKICDFRAAFGVIFAEELRDYQFWGHCDLDQYFGNIGHFITDEVLSNYDKILCLGHFTLFRNVPEINNMYLVPDRKWNQSYREAFSEERHWIFDEWPENNSSINKICKQEGVKTFCWHDSFCDLVPFVSLYRRYIFDYDREDWDLEDKKNTIFLWENGVLYQCWFGEDGEVKKQEVLYVHIRQRRLECGNYTVDRNGFYIVPNKFISVQNPNNEHTLALLKRAWLRSFRKPDEMARKIVLFKGYCAAIKRRVLKL